MNSYHLPPSYSMGSHNYPQPQFINSSSSSGSVQHMPTARQAIIPAPPSYSHCSTNSGVAALSNQGPTHMYGQRYMPQTAQPTSMQNNNMMTYRRPMTQNGEYFYGNIGQQNFPKTLQPQPTDNRYYQSQQQSRSSMANIMQTNEYPPNAFIHQNSSSHFENSFMSPQYGPQGCDMSRVPQMSGRQQSINTYPHNPHQSFPDNNLVNQNLAMNQKPIQYNSITNHRSIQYDSNKPSSWTHSQTYKPYDATNFSHAPAVSSHCPTESSWIIKTQQQTLPSLPDQGMRQQQQQTYRFPDSDFPPPRQSAVQSLRSTAMDNHSGDHFIRYSQPPSSVTPHQMIDNSSYSAQTAMPPTSTPAPYDPPSYHKHRIQILPDESLTNNNSQTMQDAPGGGGNFNCYTNTELNQILNDPDDISSILSAPYLPPVDQSPNNDHSDNVPQQISEPVLSKTESLKSLPLPSEAKEKLRQLHSQSHSIPKSELVPKVKEILVQYIGNKNFSRSLALYSERDRSKSGYSHNCHQNSILPQNYNHIKSGTNSGIKELLEHSVGFISRQAEESITPPPPPSYPKAVGVFSSVVQSPEEGPGSSPIDELVQSTTNSEEDNQRLFESSVSPIKLPLKHQSQGHKNTHSNLLSNDVLESLLGQPEPDQETYKITKDLLDAFPSPSNPCDSVQYRDETKQSPVQNKNSLLIDLLYDNADLKKGVKRKHDCGSSIPVEHSSSIIERQKHQINHRSNSFINDGFQRCSSLDSLNNQNNSHPSPDHSIRPPDPKRMRNQSHQQMSSPTTPMSDNNNATGPSRMQNYPSYRYSTSSTPSPVGHILAQLLSDNSDDSPISKSSLNTANPPPNNSNISGRRCSASDKKTSPNKTNDVKLSSEAFKCPNELLGVSHKSTTIGSSCSATTGERNSTEKFPTDQNNYVPHSEQNKDSLTTPEIFSSIEFFSECDLPPEFDLINDIDFEEFLKSDPGDEKDVFEELEKSESKIVISSADSRGDFFNDFKELICSEEMNFGRDNPLLNQKIGHSDSFKSESTFNNQVSSSMKQEKFWD